MWVKHPKFLTQLKKKKGVGMELVVLCPFKERAGSGWRRCRGWKPLHFLPVGFRGFQKDLW